VSNRRADLNRTEVGPSEWRSLRYYSGSCIAARLAPAIVPRARTNPYGVGQQRDAGALAARMCASTPMTRRLLNLLTAVSLVLCLLTVAAWVYGWWESRRMVAAITASGGTVVLLWSEMTVGPLPPHVSRAERTCASEPRGDVPRSADPAASPPPGRPLLCLPIRPPRHAGAVPGMRQGERTFMKRVTTGEVSNGQRCKRLRCVTDKLTENPGIAPGQFRQGLRSGRQTCFR
jgi:hypothetical protein